MALDKSSSKSNPSRQDLRWKRILSARAKASPPQPSSLEAGSTVPAHSTLGQRRNDPAVHEPPHVEGFQMLEFLGEGSFGTVWKAFDNSLKRIVALKFLQGMSRNSVRRFEREAMLAAQLTHPGIVGVHKLSLENNAPYLVCEFVDGVLLSDWQDVFEPSFDGIALLFEKVARSIHYAHENGVVHRDLKPANIIIDWSEEPHILDFGLAKGNLTEDSLTVDGMLIGTLAYMSPEQTRGKHAQARIETDVYSIGVMLYEQLVDELPFRGVPAMLVHQIQNKTPLAPRKLNHRIPRDLEVICLKCLEKSPEQRYASALNLAEDLRLFLNRMPINSRPVGTVARTSRWCIRNPALSLFSFALIASIFTTIVLSIFSTYRALEDADHYQKLAYAVSMKNVQHQVYHGRHHRALELLREYEPEPGQKDLRKWEWHYWSQHCWLGMREDINLDSPIRTLSLIHI